MTQKVLLAVGLLLPAITLADLSNDAAIAQAAAAVGTFTSARSNESLEEIAKKIELDEKEAQALHRAVKAKKNLQTKQARFQSEVVSDAIKTNERNEAIQERNEKIAKLPNTVGSLDASGFQTAECPVDSSQLQQTSKYLTQVNSIIKQQSLQNAEQDEEKAEADFLASLDRMDKAFDEEAKKESSVFDEAPSAPVSEANLSPEERIKKYDDAAHRFERDSKNVFAALKKAVRSNRIKARAQDKDDRKTNIIAQEGANNFEQVRNMAHQAARSMAIAYFQACEQNRIAYKREVVKGEQAVKDKRTTGMEQSDSEIENDVFVVDFKNKAKEGQKKTVCVDATQIVDQNLGPSSALAQAIASFGTQVDPNSIPTNLQNLLTGFSSAFSAATGGIPTPGVVATSGLAAAQQACVNSTKAAKQAEEYVASLGGAASGNGASVARRARTPRQSFGASQSLGSSLSNFANHGR